MKALIMAVLVAYAGLLTDAAAEPPLRLTRTIVDNGWEKVWMHCDQFGRCWKERSSINRLLESYSYASPQADARAKEGRSFSSSEGVRGGGGAR